MKVHHEEMRAIFGANRGKMEATDLKAYPDEMQSKAEHQEVPKEDAVEKPVRGWNKRHRGQNLAAKCHQKPKEQRKLATTGRTTHYAKVA
jgi:hypothetical protein